MRVRRRRVGALAVCLGVAGVLASPEGGRMQPAPAEAVGVAPRAVEAAATTAQHVELPRAAAPTNRDSSPQPRESRRGRTDAERRGRLALDGLAYPWRSLGYAVEFRAARPGTLATTNRLTRTVTVYVRAGQTQASLRITLAHELGHAVDFRYGTEERRRRYREVRGLSSSAPWFPCERCQDYASPAGDFAETFAYAVAGTGDFRSRLAPPPSPQQLAEVRDLFYPPRAERYAEPEPAPSSAAPSPTPSPGHLVVPLPPPPGD